ncbi:MAG: class A beta-lactamase-related serine hydrolase [Candidatus Krumholzibacteriota bacterium]|nr:class A beta-lactamase-related serine hydrolase [Candidatus Krumholzibacteriota bacterium]
MKKIFWLIVLSVIASEAAAESTDIEERRERVERGLLPSVLLREGPVWTIAERMDHYGVPGLSLAVINDFRIDWARGYGVIESGSELPITTETLFQAASISKPVGAVVALHLVEGGLLDLDGDVNDQLRSWKVPENDYTRDEKVTLRRILTHTAGLTVHGFRGYDVAGGEEVPTIIEVLEGREPANSDPVRVDQVPGTRFSYSGGGYTVMQLLIEDVTGRPLHQLAGEIVFTPLGMTNSSLAKPLPEKLSQKISAGHLRDGKVIEGYWFLPSGSVCCGLWTTPVDLARFAVELQQSLRGESNKMLSPATTAEMFSPHQGENFGLGMGLVGEGDDVYFSHSGGNQGFRCILIAHKDKGYGAVIMTNSDNGGLIYNEILRGIAREYGWQGFLPREYESIEDLIRSYSDLNRENPGNAAVAEGKLNREGYEMMQAGNYQAAIAILSFNVELYPLSANCYDSLAEAYLKKGDRESAIRYYNEALQILDEHPRENARYQNLKDNIQKHLEELQKR